MKNLVSSVSASVSLALCLLLCSCGQEPGQPASSTSTPSTPNTPAKARVALIMKSLANEFFKTMADGAEAHQKENPDSFELIANGIKNETDLAAQVNLVEQMVAQQVDAIVIAPADSKALVPALKAAREAGVLVINIDNQLDAEVLKQAGLEVPFVGPDNRAGAKQVGDALAATLAKGDKVAIIEGVTTAFNSQQRRQGFEDAMKSAGMAIVSTQSGQWEMDKANNVASAMISEHHGLKAILCANDSMALGAVAAVKSANKTGKVAVVGFDNISAVQPMLLDGRILATADQYGGKLAVFGIEAALQILDGKATPEDQTTAVNLVTKETLSKTE